jgi:RHS repeat-associated protein
MLVPNRHGSTPAYRYGFQGQEKDDEIKGEGNSLNYTFRMHDPRVGRFFTPDPLFRQYPHYTPYSFSGNKVMAFIELEGLEEFSVHTYSFSPFASFGGGYKGEGPQRKFGSKVDIMNPENANFKLGASAKINLANNRMIGKVQGYNTLSTHHILPIAAKSDTEIESQNYDPKKSELNFHASSNNEAFFYGASPNVDAKVNAKFTKLSDNVFSVAGTIIGDRFPSNEAYLQDDLGNKVFLGVSGVDINLGSISPTFGPGVLLFGDNKKMSSFSFSVKYQEINGKTVFQNVILSDGTKYNLNEWNKIFESLNPSGNKTGTEIKGNRIKTNIDETD